MADITLELLKEFERWRRDFTHLKLRLRVATERLEEAVLRNNKGEVGRWAEVAYYHVYHYRLAHTRYVHWRKIRGFALDECHLKNTRDECDHYVARVVSMAQIFERYA